MGQWGWCEQGCIELNGTQLDAYEARGIVEASVPIRFPNPYAAEGK